MQSYKKFDRYTFGLYADFYLLLLILMREGCFIAVLQLPSRISDREIARLALLFSPATMETVALLYIGISEAEIGQATMDNIGNAKRFNRELLHTFLNKGHKRKVTISLLWLHYLVHTRQPYNILVSPRQQFKQGNTEAYKL